MRIDNIVSDEKPRVITCPECGFTGVVMCTPTFDGYLYTCPQCGEDFVKPDDESQMTS